MDLGMRRSFSVGLLAALVFSFAVVVHAAVPRAGTLYQDPNCFSSTSKPCYQGSVYAFTSKRASFNAACPLGARKAYTDKTAFFPISRSGRYHFDGYIQVAYGGKAVARKARLVVSGSFVTTRKTTGTFHLYEPGCKKMSYTLTAY